MCKLNAPTLRAPHRLDNVGKFDIVSFLAVVEKHLLCIGR